MQQRYFSLLALSTALIWVGACGGGSGSGVGPTTPKVNVASVEQASFSLVNTEREALMPTGKLSRDQLIGQIAREYSERMRDEGFFSHKSPDGRSLAHRLRAAGIEFSVAGENLAKVTNHADPATFAHTILMQQPEHRENILGPDYRVLGVGAAKGDGTVWITQIFIRE